jgi:dihydropyrimidinase/dihydroorotase
LWEALNKGRGIDVIGSDHVCWGRTLAEIEKTGLEYKKDIWTVYEGFVGRGEGMLPLLLSEGVNKGRISLERLVQVCCEDTARIFGLYPKKGTISIGSDADLVLVDLDKTKTMTRDQVLNYLGWSIYEGWEIKGWPVMTILRGEIKVEWNEGEPRTTILGEPGGEYLPRKPEGSSLPPMQFD